MANKFKEARKVECPKCGAKQGEPCVLTAGGRKGQVASTLHNERLRASTLKASDQGDLTQPDTTGGDL